MQTDIEVDGIVYDVEALSFTCVKANMNADNPDDYHGYTEVQFAVWMNDFDIADHLCGNVWKTLEEKICEYIVEQERG